MNATNLQKRLEAMKKRLHEMQAKLYDLSSEIEDKSKATVNDDDSQAYATVQQYVSDAGFEFDISIAAMDNAIHTIVSKLIYK